MRNRYYGDVAAYAQLHVCKRTQPSVHMKVGEEESVHGDSCQLTIGTCRFYLQRVCQANSNLELWNSKSNLTLNC